MLYTCLFVVVVKNQISQYSEKLHTIVLGWSLGSSGSFPELVFNVGRRAWWLQVLLSGALPTLSLLLFFLNPPLLFSLHSPTISHSQSTITSLPSFLLHSEPEWRQWPVRVERTMTILQFFLTQSQAQSWETSEDHDEYCPAPALAWIFICRFLQFLGFYNLINAFMIRNTFKHPCGISSGYKNSKQSLLC